jgi:hypothetical protein
LLDYAEEGDIRHTGGRGGLHGRSTLRRGEVL